MFALGIDTSNYATSLAIVDILAGEVVCAKKKFLPIKENQLGLRQSEALFHHTVVLPKLFAELKPALPPVVDLAKIKFVGVSTKPRNATDSYMPCFLAGESFACAFAEGSGAKLLRTTHQDGHIEAALFGSEIETRPQKFLLFHLSGGTSELLYVEEGNCPQVIGGTLDLYAGQAVDRLGARLGFAFPAGENVSVLAEICDEDIDPKVSVKGTYFNFSGLQNQCEKLLVQGRTKEYAAKYCIVAIAKALHLSIQRAEKTYPNLPLFCAGGVASSTVLREYFKKKGRQVYFAPPELSSDNAVGVAFLAAKGFLNG